VAKALHFNSTRRDRPFVPLNSPRPETLLESSCSATSRRVFTTRTDRAGIFVEADGGIFLDEIAELSPALRCCCARPAGGRDPPAGAARSQVDVRVVAATNKDLENLTSGAFRQTCSTG
jgi:transcriptional regulator with GAF, ATPase, and Fis domain